MRIAATSLLVLAGLALAAPAPATVTIVFETVGNPGNPPDTPATNCGGGACGAVPYPYLISRYEITNAQYAEFLNAVGAEDPNGLYDPQMSSDARGGILRSGLPGSYIYPLKDGHGSKPVVFVSFYDALRFVNWLHNGQPIAAQGPGTTEDGAYTITPQGVAANSITRNPGARFVLPTDAEWYKAAYYEPVSAAYFDYPTGSDGDPSSDAPPGGPDSANYYDGTFARTGEATFDPGFDYLTDVGAYPFAVSPYGTHDQGGNVAEWCEDAVAGTSRRTRGGSWDNFLVNLSVTGQGVVDPLVQNNFTGFRVAVPEASGAGLAALGALAALAGRSGRLARLAGRRLPA